MYDDISYGLGRIPSIFLGELRLLPDSVVNGIGDFKRKRRMSVEMKPTKSLFSNSIGWGVNNPCNLLPLGYDLRQNASIGGMTA